jgi:hypothetical protein
MTLPSSPDSSQPTALVFGLFSNQWAWRVEWRDASGRSRVKDFPQRDSRPGEAKEKAKAFREELGRTLAA